MADKLIPKQALNYIKNKKLHPAFSYKDVWNEEHAAAFTVAKAMQLDVLFDIKTAVEKAIADGTTFEQFKKDLKPTLMQKGWWGRKEITDPLTGETVNAQLGSDHRLKTIYQTNLRSAYQKGQYERTMKSDAHPYLMYRIGASVHHREQHLKWNNLILPKGDPIWNSIFPPNSYGCKCYTVAVTQARKERYERDGVPAYNPDIGKTVRFPVQTAAPKTAYTVYENVRKGIIERIPQGITPGFNWNQGGMSRNYTAIKNVISKRSFEAAVGREDFIKTLFNNTIQREAFKNFVEKSLHEDKWQGFEPVGFIDKTVSTWLKKNKGIDIGDNIIIGLESRLITGCKAIRHSITDETELIIDTLLYGKVFWGTDGNGIQAKESLIYLHPYDAENWLKIAVRPQSNVLKINEPSIRTFFKISNTAAQTILNFTRIK
ncbi:MAG: phage minor head protein [Bacteroides sp.]|nr:phage minor head protein [Prevotella sp.]MCM1407085.1 phage minor head protein [Treponema brennaborense]MCM1470237.1 phage minor head protein [Bacteroides sp.]